MRFIPTRKLAVLAIITLFVFHIPVSLTTAQDDTVVQHQHYVNSVEWSNNGSILASGSRDQVVKLWTAEGELISNKITTIGHNSSVLDLSWSPNDTYLGSAGSDGDTFIWDVSNTSRLLPSMIITGQSINYAKSVAWSPNATTNSEIAIGHRRGNIHLFEANASKSKYFAEGSDILLGEGSRPNGPKICCGETDIPLSDVIYAIKWSNDGTRLAAIAKDGSLKIFDKNDITAKIDSPAEYNATKQGTNAGNVLSMEANGDFSTFLVGSEFGVSILEQSGQSYVNDSANFVPIDCEGCINNDIDFSPSGDRVMIASGDTLRIYQWNDGFVNPNSPSFSLNIHDQFNYENEDFKVVDASWKPDNPDIVAFASGADVIVWDVAQNQQVFRIQGEIPEETNVLLISIGILLGIIVLYVGYKLYKRQTRE